MIQILTYFGYCLFQSINKRFQRLESHVVTLARSVAHLSSEMRTQHLMVQVRQEMNLIGIFEFLTVEPN